MLRRLGRGDRGWRCLVRQGWRVVWRPLGLPPLWPGRAWLGAPRRLLPRRPADESGDLEFVDAAAASSAAVTPASAAASASQPAAASSASAASGGGSSSGPGCASMDLGAHVGLAQGTAGSIYQVIYFTNLSNAPCTLYGYPGVALAAGSSQVNQVGAAASRSTATAPTVVTLGAGQSANATLRIVEAGNYPTGTCQPTATTLPADLPAGPDHADLPGLQVDRVRVVGGQAALDERDDGGDRRLIAFPGADRWMRWAVGRAGPLDALDCWAWVRWLRANGCGDGGRMQAELGREGRHARAGRGP